ncbi:MAG: hypoxanthine phosphoribosyltransferase [Gemmatimonadota bacterium]|nr:hypoxanthine phosphoribosyltransferase [Gemmatimonadota bacterium]
MTAGESGPGWGRRRLRRVVYTADDIRRRVTELGREIAGAYGPEDCVLVLGMLKGSFIFVADLVREISIPLHVDFLVAASYGKRLASSGDVRLLYNPRTSVAGRNVLLVEDIIDSGNTLRRVIPPLLGRNPASLEICTLLHKRRVRLGKDARWVGFEAPEEFLVGYGLDFGEDFRHLPYIGSL